MRRIVVTCAIALLFVSPISKAQKTGELPDEPRIDVMGPVSAVGHGAILNSEGKPIEATPESVLEAQRAYLKRLYEHGDEKQQSTFRDKQRNVLAGKQWEQRDQIIANSSLIAWLIDEVKPANASSLESINTALRVELAPLPRNLLQKQSIDDRESAPSHDLIENPKTGRHADILVGDRFEWC